MSYLEQLMDLPSMIYYTTHKCDTALLIHDQI